TVSYARKIIFAENDSALKAIDAITSIHKVVESKRGKAIPDWAYRDVLFMLIHYSIAAYEVLEHKLSEGEYEEVFNVFYRVGTRMNINGLPTNYKEWLKVRKHDLENDLEKSKFSVDLYRQYRKHLGSFRYAVLLEGQAMVVPEKVRLLLNMKNYSLLSPIVPLYKLSRKIRLDGFIKSLVLPQKFKKEINELDVN
ncbi:MAG: DUF2236 domain-containing protein, partial [Bacteroidota bacterium]|nr:DUF2236 domain-containing protein [Bacteroidota bacterium]